jgi:hypothetical protein
VEYLASVVGLGRLKCEIGELQLFLYWERP